MKYLIVGAGLSGCTLAHRLSEAGHTVHIIEKRDHIAGNCYDELDRNGILVNRYGAHLFHTNSERVWTYINQFAEWIPWYHKVVGRIQDKYFPIPVNIDTVNLLCNTHLQTETEMKEWLQRNTVPSVYPENSEEVALARVGPVLYEMIFKEYTFKQWAKYPAELDPSVLERIPVRTDHNPNYFSDRFQALPKDGYTRFIQKMIDSPLISVSVNTEYCHEMKEEYESFFTQLENVVTLIFGGSGTANAVSVNDIMDGIYQSNLGPALQSYSQASFNYYMSKKDDDGVLYMNLTTDPISSIWFKTAEELSAIGARLHAGTAYLTSTKDVRLPYPQMEIVDTTFGANAAAKRFKDAAKQQAKADKEQAKAAKQQAKAEKTPSGTRLTNTSGPRQLK